MAALLVIALVLAMVLVELWRRRSARPAPRPAPPAALRVPRPPADLFLDDNHTWVRLAADGTLRLGVDDWLTELLGQVDRVELPGPGARVQRGEPLLVLHQGPRRLSVPSPAAGEIAGTNPLVQDNPRVVVDDPYGLGWVAALRPRDHREALAPLHVGNGASGRLRAELERVVDFFAGLVPGAAPLLADGGLPRRGALAELDDAGWAAFQRRFLS
jgi:glycine cleavage system H protein